MYDNEDGRDAARRGIESADEDVIPTRSIETRLGNRALEPRWRGEPPAGFSALVLDSREARPGVLFCAIAGAHHDGHDFVAAAGRAGALAAVVERPVPGGGLEAGFPLLQVTDTRAAAAHLASLFHGDPGAELRLVGVTGTNGKTTTTWILRHLLEELGPAGALGTLGTVTPDRRVHPGSLTTPDPQQLIAALSDLRDAGTESVAMEVSSHALDQRRPDALRFRAACFTNLSREHLDYHGDMGTYLEAKLRLVELVAPEGVCVVHAAEPAWEPVRERARRTGVRVASFGAAVDGGSDGAEAPADVCAAEVHHEAGGSRWRLESAAGAADVRLPLPGDFNVQNALGAAAIALDLGLDPETVAARLGSVPPVPGRMEVLRREPSLVLRDYAHTPDSFERVLGSLRRRTPGRLFLVFGAGGDRDPGKRPIMGRIASEHCDLTFLTTDNPRSEDPAEIARQTAAEMDPARYEIQLDRERAIARALEAAGPDDVVVLLGKGHETYQIVGDRKLPFDEREIVGRLTAGGGSGAGGGRGPGTGPRAGGGPGTTGGSGHEGRAGADEAR